MAAVPSAALPGRSEIENWQWRHLEDAAAHFRGSAGDSERVFGRHVRNILDAPWEGQAKDAAYARATADQRVAGRHSEVQREAATIAENGAGDVRAGKRDALEAISEAENDGFRVGEDLSVHDTRTHHDLSVLRDRQLAADEYAEDIRWNTEQLVATDTLVGRRLSEKAGELDGIRFDGEDDRSDDRTIQAVDFHQGPQGQAEDEANRRQNEIDAFKEVFGREPVSEADWTTAAALDPHSYDPMYQGVDAEVRVVEIEPVPGQGVVRASQWIEQRDVTSFPPNQRDFGNNRVADPHFDPADTKVTTYIDYENGLVVMRQNPSVELNSDGGPGQVKVGVPEAAIQETGDGAVRIQYDAANPFAPEPFADPPWPMEDNAWTVNGDLVFTPAVDGVRVDGTRTDYPSMEVYQDMPDGSTRTVLIDPAAAGNSTGPMVNLPQHHELGVGGKAFEPFDTGAWNSKYDVKVPLPSTDFGPTADPPAVAPSRLPPGVPGVAHI